MEKDLERKNKYLALYKQDPSLLQRMGFVLSAVNCSAFKFEDYPEEIKKSDLFIYKYFSKSVAIENDYKHIPLHLLNDHIFIMDSLKKNPDIFFFIGKKLDKDYFYSLLESTPNLPILKYASAEKLNNREYCEKFISTCRENYKYAPLSIKEDVSICAKVFSGITYDFLDPELVKAIPKSIIENPKFLDKLLFEVNIGLFPFLPNKIKNDFALAEKAVKMRSEYYKDLSKELRDSPEFLKKVLFPSDLYNRNSKLNSMAHYDCLDILLEQPLSFFNQENLDTYQRHIQIKFHSFPDEHKGDINFIKTALASIGNCHLNFIKLIKNEKLKTELLVLYSFPSKMKIDDSERSEIFHNQANIYINNFALKEKLENTNSVVSSPVKKHKI